MSDLLAGDLTRLVAYDPERGGELMEKWYRDSEFAQLYDFPPVRPRDLKRTQEKMRTARSLKDPKQLTFFIETLEEQVVIGECELEVNVGAHRDAHVAIGIGDREYWGKGYGSDAMRVLLRYGFMEWRLHRITLSAFAYNPRAIRVYEKVGFKHEGRIRGHLNRFGERHDSVSMGILQSEWEASRNE